MVLCIIVNTSQLCYTTTLKDPKESSCWAPWGVMLYSSCIGWWKPRWIKISSLSDVKLIGSQSDLLVFLGGPQSSTKCYQCKYWWSCNYSEHETRCYLNLLRVTIHQTSLVNTDLYSAFLLDGEGGGRRERSGDSCITFVFTWNAINTLSHDSHELGIQLKDSLWWARKTLFVRLLYYELVTLPEAVAT